MIGSTELRKGVIIEIDGKLYQVIEHQHVKMKRTALIRTKLRDIQNGHSLERTFSSDDKLTRARLEYRSMQYLYNDENLYYLMDEETFDQTPISADQMGDAVNFLKEGKSLQVASYKGEIISVELPITVDLEVADTGPDFKGDTATAGTKPAKLETGVVIQVPMFVSNSDVIRVDTRDGSYLERVG